MKRYDWESEELFQLRKIKYKLIDTCEQPSMSNFSKLCGLVENEEARLIKRDAELHTEKVCSHCQNDILYICEPCMDVWSKELDKEIKTTNDTINNR